MEFIEALKRVFSPEKQAKTTEQTRAKLRQAWGLDDEEPAGSVAHEPAGTVSEYDRKQWHRRLRRILAELPDSRGRWEELMADAHALGLETSWIEQRQREEFAFLIRGAVSDLTISEEEHEKLELARKLIGMPPPEAERLLHSITAEAEAFFGSPVKEASA